jgi:PST family polysaccharide transporter
MTTLVRTSVLNGFAVLTRVTTAMALNKVLALYVGPAGYAMIGQFQNFVTTVTTLASGAIGTGVTKHTAEYDGQPERRLAVWRTAFLLGLGGSVTLAVAIAAGSRSLSAWLLHDPAYASVFSWLAVSLVLLVMNGLMLAALTGQKAVGSLVAANILGGVAGALVAIGLVMRLGLYGALLAQAVTQAVAFLFTLWFFRRINSIRWGELLGPLDRKLARSLGGFALMTLTSSIVVPMAMLVIRDALIDGLGLRVAGLWQAVWRISDLHLMLLTNTLVAYFLPRFSEVATGPALRREVVHAYRFVVPLVLVSSSTIFALRSLLVPLLLTRAFLPVVDVLGWQLLGDVLKIGSWVAAYALLSRARTRAYIMLELVFDAVLVLAIIGGSRIDGLRGATLGYAITYALYWIAVHRAIATSFVEAQGQGLAADGGASAA